MYTRACVRACARTPAAGERASERSYISSAAASLRQGLRVRGADAEGAGGPPQEGSAASSSIVSVCLDRVLLSVGGRVRDGSTRTRTDTHAHTQGSGMQSQESWASGTPRAPSGMQSESEQSQLSFSIQDGVSATASERDQVFAGNSTGVAAKMSRP